MREGHATRHLATHYHHRESLFWLAYQSGVFGLLIVFTAITICCSWYTSSTGLAFVETSKCGSEVKGFWVWAGELGETSICHLKRFSIRCGELSVTSGASTDWGRWFGAFVAESRERCHGLGSKLWIEYRCSMQTGFERHLLCAVQCSRDADGVVMSNQLHIAFIIPSTSRIQSNLAATSSDFHFHYLSRNHKNCITFSWLWVKPVTLSTSGA